MMSLQLSTLGCVGGSPVAGDAASGNAVVFEPHVGYTPFAEHDGDLLIFTSQLSLHTRDLLENPQAAVMLIDDEQDTSQIFARTRLSLQVRSHRVAEDDPEREQLLDIYQARLGKTVQLLRTLPDFILFRLEPVSGMFVMGFGQAYHLTGPGLTAFDHARSA